MPKHFIVIFQNVTKIRAEKILFGGNGLPLNGKANVRQKCVVGDGHELIGKIKEAQILLSY